MDNAVDRFKFAHSYGYEILKKWLFHYIIQHFLPVSKTAAFQTLDAELFKPFMDELLKQNKIH